jgi:competence protein ComEC
MAVLPAIPFARNDGVELHVLDVGQGDAILLRTKPGRWVLFDAGPAWSGGDAGRSTILPYILRRGGTLEGFVLSHPHTDHVGGAASVLMAMGPPTYWDAAFAGGSQAYGLSLVAARKQRVGWRRVHPGDSVLIDGVTLRFLAPDSAWTVGLNDPNLASTIAVVQYGVVRFLLVGDAERAEEDWLLEHYKDELRADVLKVGHHGSSTSSSDAFLAAVQPDVAVISVGAGNLYGHPSPDVLRALARVGAEVVRTDQAGTVVVRTDGSRIEVEAGGDRWQVVHDSSKR